MQKFQKSLHDNCYSSPIPSVITPYGKNFLVEDKSMFGKQLSFVPIFSLDETLQQEIQEISHSQSLIITD